MSFLLLSIDKNGNTYNSVRRPACSAFLSFGLAIPWSQIRALGRNEAEMPYIRPYLCGADLRLDYRDLLELGDQGSTPPASQLMLLVVRIMRR